MVNNTNRVRSRFEERALGNVRRLFLPNRPNRTKTVDYIFTTGSSSRTVTRKVANKPCY